MPERSAASSGAAAGAGLAVLAACLAVIASTPGDAYWINDCGNKALVAERLLETGFRRADFSRPARAIDPDGRWFAIPAPFSLRRNGEFVSAYPLAYPALAAPSLAVFGPRGLRLPAALGSAAAAALLAAWLTPALGRGGALGAGLVLGIASPLLFYGVTVWEHSLTVALALASWLLLAAPRSGRWCAAGALLGVACWLREELALMLPAVIAAALLRRESRGQIAAFAGGAALPVAALALMNAHLYGDALGGHVAANLQGGIFAGRPAVDRSSALPGLLGGFGHGARERHVFVLAALALPLAGAFGARKARAPTALVLGLAGLALAAWAVALSRILGGPARLQELVLHNGLLLQWPLLALTGLGALRVLREPAFAGLRTGIVAGLLFAALVLAAGILLPTSFGAQVGAGLHWGPRLLLPALPALVALAAAAVTGRSNAIRFAWAALAVAGLVSSAASIWFLAHQKLDAARFEAKLRSLAPRVIVTSHPFLAQQLAGLWTAKPMLLALDAEALRAATGAVQRAGEPGFVFIGPPGARLATTLSGVECEVALEPQGARLGYFDLGAERCRFAAENSSPPARRPGSR